MAHSHLVIRHLLRQLDHFAKSRPQRDRRPAWLTDVIQQVSQLFEPLSGVARVGYECDLSEAGWELRMYLGNSEIVGGKDDGQTRSASFELNLLELLGQFRELQEFTWNATATTADSGRSFLTVRGLCGEHPLSVKLYSLPPRDMAPALREFSDGRVEACQIPE